MNRKSGGLIGKKVVITPTDGSPDASASGIWTLQDVADYEAAGTFPQPDVAPNADDIVANVTMQATETQDLAVTFSGASDPDGDTVFDWTITESSGSLSLTPSSFTNVSSATTTFTAGEVSTDTPVTVTVTVTDEFGLSASKNFTFTILDDTSPVADGGTIAVASVEEGDAYSVDCKTNFTDDNGDGNLTFSLASGTLPVGAALNTSTGVISDSAINVVTGNTGTVTYSYSITATDSPKGQTATQAYSSPVTKQPIDAVWSAYGSWGSCSVSCGGGTQSRTRTCTEQLYGGITCANTDGGNSSQSQACNTQSCWNATIATGGSKVAVGDYYVHTFNSTSTFAVSSVGTDNTVEYLIIAGGGGGGAAWTQPHGHGGGGGAGGYKTSYGTSGANSGSLADKVITASSYSIIVGGGGGGGGNGSTSSGLGISSTGGGKGGNYNINGSSGGSGGGGAGRYNRAGGSGTSAQGRNGGSGVQYIHSYYVWDNWYKGGGGGGASGTGVNGGNGGAGLANSLKTGSNETRAGGGGGSNGSGGSGGGANGSATGTGGSGSANTGGGGGGGRYGGSGGKGVVIIRYRRVQ